MFFTQGIILKIANFREHDERVVLFTKEYGKLSVVAKGAKKIEAKLRGNLNIFNHVIISFVPGANFNILTFAECEENFVSIEQNPYAYKAAFSMVHLVESVFEENIKDEELFESLNYAIRKLDECGKGQENTSSLYSWLLLKKFQMKILENQGYEGGLSDHHAFDDGLALSVNSFALLDMLKGNGSGNLTLSKNDLNNIENVFTRIFAYIFGYKLNSWIPITS